LDKKFAQKFASNLNRKLSKYASKFASGKYIKKIERTSTSGHFGLANPAAQQRASRTLGAAAAAQLACRPSLLAQSARQPRPGRNLGLGRQFGPPRLPAWAERNPASRAIISAVDSNHAAQRHFLLIKNPGRLPFAQTLTHFPFYPSPRCFSLAIQEQQQCLLMTTGRGKKTAPPWAPSPVRVLASG
jgi:hypothetical protein